MNPNNDLVSGGTADPADPGLATKRWKFKRLFLQSIALILLPAITGIVACKMKERSEPTPAPSWPPKWYGATKMSCQWSSFFLAKNPDTFQPLDGAGYGEDIHASYFYWGYPAGLPEGTNILIEGDFPHSRSINFQVSPPWDPQNADWRSGEGAPEISLLDEDIIPDPGHTNPFLPGADRNATKRHFHITFELRSGNPVTLNPKAGIPPYRAPGNTRIGGHRSGKKGDHGPLIWYRIYAPDHFDPKGGVELPIVRIQRPGEEPVLAPVIAEPWYNERQEAKYMVKPYRLEENACLESGLAAKDAELMQKRSRLVEDLLAELDPPGNFDRRVVNLTKPDRSLIYYKMFGLPRLMCATKHALWRARRLCPRLDAQMYNRGHDKPPPGNDEHTNGFHMHQSYLVSLASLKRGEALLIRGKAPKTPRTLAGNPRMEPSEQLRYWSLCLYYGKPALTVLSCIMDEGVVLDSKGYFTMVFTAKKDRPSNAIPRCGITWRPWKAAFSSLEWRYQSTNARVNEHALQRVAWEKGDPSLPTYDENAVKDIMKEYFPASRYVTLAKVEALGCKV